MGKKKKKKEAWWTGDKWIAKQMVNWGPKFPLSKTAT